MSSPEKTSSFDNSNKEFAASFANESSKHAFCSDLFLKNGPFALMFLDTSFQVIEVNERFQKLFGQDKSQLIGKNIFSFIKGEDALQLKVILENRDQKKSPLLTSLYLIRYDYSMLKVDTFVQKMQAKNGELHYGLLMFDKEFCPDTDWMEVKQEVFRAIVDTQEQERLRIGRQLHDSVAQLLYAIRLNLQSFVTAHPESLVEIKPIKQVLNDAIHQVRNISVDLVPAVLHDFGLKAAINAMCENISMSDFEVLPLIPEKSDDLDEDLQLAIFRIVQELLNNAMKHASASKVKVTLQLHDDRIQLEVKDNGQGFELEPEESMSRGTGLRTIKNRTDLYQGNFHIDTTERGTTVKIILYKVLKWQK